MCAKPIPRLMPVVGEPTRCDEARPVIGAFGFP
jgi:hypothetical protein